MAPEVVIALKGFKGGKTISLKNLENNPWVTGKGEKGELRKKLPDGWLIDALRLFLQTGYRSSDFAGDWCHPAYLCCQWEATQKKKYGEVAETSQAFHRTCKSLRTIRTLRAVRAWHGDPNRGGIKNFGLQELTDVLEEMDRMRAGQDKSIAPALGSDGQHTNPSVVDPVEPVGADDAGSFDEYIDEEYIESTRTPFTKKAKELADASRRRISVYPEAQASQFEAEAAVRPVDCRCLVLVEAPTSSLFHMHDLLKKVARYGPSDYDLWVPLGGRWGMIDKVTGAIAKHLGRTNVFVWTASGGTQTARLHTTVGLWSPSRTSPRCLSLWHEFGVPCLHIEMLSGVDRNCLFLVFTWVPPPVSQLTLAVALQQKSFRRAFGVSVFGGVTYPFALAPNVLGRLCEASVC